MLRPTTLRMKTVAKIMVYTESLRKKIISIKEWRPSIRDFKDRKEETFWQTAPRDQEVSDVFVVS
jgi:hypothetical protein